MHLLLLVPVAFFIACSSNAAARQESEPDTEDFPLPASGEQQATRSAYLVPLRDRPIIARALAACSGPNDSTDERARVARLEGCYRPDGPGGVVAAPFLELHPAPLPDERGAASRQVTWEGAPDEFNRATLWRASWRLFPEAIQVRWNGNYHGVEMCLREEAGGLVGYYATSKDFPDDELLVPVKYSRAACSRPEP